MQAPCLQRNLKKINQCGASLEIIAHIGPKTRPGNLSGRLTLFSTGKHRFNTQMIIKFRPFYAGVSTDKGIVFQLLECCLLKFRIPLHGRRENTTVSKLNSSTARQNGPF